MMIPNPDAYSQTAKLTLKRTFAASRDRVFRAWTVPEELKKWWGPKGCITRSAEVELREGGKYRFGMQFPGQDIFYVNGIYQEIVPPEKLVFTWRWEKADMDVGETLVTLEFNEQGNTTEVILTHERLPNETAIQIHEQGWNSMAERLDDMFTRKEI